MPFIHNHNQFCLLYTSQAGHILVGEKGDGQHRVDQRGEHPGEEGGDERRRKAVGQIARHESGAGSDRHHPLDAQVQVSDPLVENLADGAEEQGGSRRDGGDQKFKQHSGSLPSREMCIRDR